MRSIWKGSLGFGLITLPVKMYAGVDDHKVALHQYHSACGGRVREPKYCPNCERFVDKGEIVKGYEVSPDTAVLLSEADFDRLPLKSAKTIQIEGFTSDAIDPRSVNKSYILAPDKDYPEGQKAFVLLREVMARKRVMAVGKLTYRDREHLCILYPYKGVLLLQTLCYADELRDVAQLAPPPQEFSEKALTLAEQLVDKLTGVFPYESYRDEYNHALQEVIMAKLEGKEPPSLPEPTKAKGSIEEMLEASLGG